MATIIQGPPDPRFAVVEQGVARGVESFFEKHEKRKKEQKFMDAFRAINAATSYDDAVAAMGLMDREILANPGAMQLLSDQLTRKFPKQEAVMVDTPTGVETVGVREGDVSGALATAEGLGGRLATETELERKREFEDVESSTKVIDSAYKRTIGAEKLKLEERRTAAAERRALAAEMRARKAGVTEKDKEIGRTAMLLGGDIDRAMRIVYGLEETDVDPVTGEARVLDKTTGRVAIVPAELLQDMDTVPTPAEGKTLWDAAVSGTGPFSALRAAAALPTAYMGVFHPDKTVESRARLNTAVQGFIRAVANSDRFPVAEQERIRKDFGIGTSMWVHPETLRRRMVTLHTDLTLKRAQAMRDAQSAALPSKDRASAKRDVTEISNFLAQMGVPEEHLNGSENDVSAGVPEIVQKNYPEVTFERWNRLSKEQRKKLMETYPDAGQ